MDDQEGGDGREGEIESRWREERERRKEAAEGPNAPNVSMTKGTKRSSVLAMSGAYLVHLFVSCRLARASGVVGSVW